MWGSCRMLNTLVTVLNFLGKPILSLLLSTDCCYCQLEEKQKATCDQACDWSKVSFAAQVKQKILFLLSYLIHLIIARDSLSLPCCVCVLDGKGEIILLGLDL